MSYTHQWWYANELQRLLLWNTVKDGIFKHKSTQHSGLLDPQITYVEYITI